MSSHRIQVVVDDRLNDDIHINAHALGLSVSSYARLALMRALSRDERSLDCALSDIESGQVERVTLDDFKQQINRL